jgi:hypothetical protein
VKRSDAVLEPAVVGSGINEAGKPELPDIPQPLKPGMFDYIIDQVKWNAYKTVNRIIDNLPFICFVDHPGVT